MEDVLDKFNYEVMRRKLVADANAEADADAANTSKVCKFIPTCCNTNLSPVQAKCNVKMGKKIKEITRRLEETFGHKVDLSLEKLKLEIESVKASSQTPILHLHLHLWHMNLRCVVGMKIKRRY